MIGIKFPNNMKISIIIPVYNEEKTLPALVAAVEGVDLPLEKELIFVDDCSSDRSREILSSYNNKHKDLFLDKNQGKGVAVKPGFEEAAGYLENIPNAHLEYNPPDYTALIKPIISGE